VRRPPRITVVVIRSAAKTAMSQAQTSSKTSLAMQVRKLRLKAKGRQLTAHPETPVSGWKLALVGAENPGR
jgi:hypothetical protein